MPDTTKLAALLTLAERATPGPYAVHSEDLRGGRYWCVRDPRGSFAASDTMDFHEDNNGEADAAFFEAMHPGVAAALVRVAMAAQRATEASDLLETVAARMECRAALAALTEAVG